MLTGLLTLSGSFSPSDVVIDDNAAVIFEFHEVSGVKEMLRIMLLVWKRMIALGYVWK